MRRAVVDQSAGATGKRSDRRSLTSTGERADGRASRSTASDDSCGAPQRAASDHDMAAYTAHASSCRISPSRYRTDLRRLIRGRLLGANGRAEGEQRGECE
jgi:hypothetical protein